MIGKKISFAMVLFVLLSLPHMAGIQEAAGGTCEELIAKGEEFRLKGDFGQAAQVWEQALGSVNPDADPLLWLDTLIRLAGTYQTLGFHKEALATLLRGIPASEKIDDRGSRILFTNTLGDVYLSLGKPDKAAECIEKILPKARGMEDSFVAATVLNSLGNLFAMDRDYKGAAAVYEECLERIRGAGDDREPALDSLESDALVNLARALFLSKRFQRIVPALTDAATRIGNLPDSHGKARNLIALSLLILKVMERKSEIRPASSDMGDIFPGMAHDLLGKAGDIAEASGDTRLMSCAHGYMARLYESRGRVPEALRLTRRAAFLAQEGRFPEILYLWQWQTGRLLKARNDTENAVAAYQRAMETLAPVRREFFGEYRNRQESFDENIRPVYVGLAEIFLERAEAAKDRESRERMIREAVTVMEQMKAAELQSFYEDECVADQRYADIPERSPKGIAGLYPVSLPDRLTLILYLPDSVKLIPVPVDSGTLKKRAAALRRDLQNRTSYGFRENAEKLYDWLIRPLDPEFARSGVDTLIIAPDGALRLIPLSALYDGEHFLIEKYALGIVPAMTLTDLRAGEIGKAPVLVGGLSESVQGFSPLPSVKAELREVRKIMDAKKIFQDREYTTDNLVSEFKGNAYSMLHMATHGVFGGTFRETFLLTYDDRLTMNRLEELISLGRFRETPVELLTLSACQTAMGDERAALGLAGVAVKAGVRSAIATLWFVDDEATSLAVREFYRQLKTPGLSKAKALQKAQKTLIAQDRYWHPVYWAPFLLIGNWM